MPTKRSSRSSGHQAIFLQTGVAQIAGVTKVLQSWLGGMQSKKTVYVAETDENGVVLCVWIDVQGRKSTRPFNPKRNRFDMSAPAEFSGAKPEAIKSWMLQKQLQ